MIIRRRMRPSDLVQKVRSCSSQAPPDSSDNKPPERTFFNATYEWQEVLPGMVCPAGLEYRMDMSTEKSYARKIPPKDSTTLPNIKVIEKKLEPKVDTTVIQKFAEQAKPDQSLALMIREDVDEKREDLDESKNLALMIREEDGIDKEKKVDEKQNLSLMVREEDK